MYGVVFGLQRLQKESLVFGIKHGRDGFWDITEW